MFSDLAKISVNQTSISSDVLGLGETFNCNLVTLQLNFAYFIEEEIPCGTFAEINLLQAATLLQDIGLVRLITELASKQGQDVIDEILNYEVKTTLQESNGCNWRVAPRCKWILNASVIHLATYWHVESLVHFLENYPELKDKSTGSLREVSSTLFKDGIQPTKLCQPNLYTPLHIASSDDRSAIPLIILIKVIYIRLAIEIHIPIYIFQYPQLFWLFCSGKMERNKGQIKL